MPALYSVQARTHTGSVREVNEDAVSTVLDWRAKLDLTDEDLRTRGHLFALADGMGGHAAGEVASNLVIEQLFETYYTAEWIDPQQALASAITAANTALCDKADSDFALMGMGTTLTAALLLDDTLLIANVGDSRAYRYHRQHLAQVTRDHSWVAEQVTAGVISAEEAERHPYRNVITRSLGPDREPKPDFFRVHVEAGDLILLCSDGLSNLVQDAELAEFLNAYSTDEAADILIERALERGAPDNVTLAIVEVLETSHNKSWRIWPWFLLVLAFVAVLGFAFRDLFVALLPGPSGIAAATSTPMENIPTATLLPATATSPPPSPTATPVPATEPAPTLEPTPSPAVIRTPLPPPSIPIAQPILFGPIALPPVQADDSPPDFQERFGVAGEGRIGIPGPGKYVYYLEGPIDKMRRSQNGLIVTILHQTESGELQNYIINFPGLSVSPSQLVRGDHIRVAAQPQTPGDREGLIWLDGVLAMDGLGRRVWVLGNDLSAWLETQTAIWVYSVHGPGGGNGLGVQSETAAFGQPVVLWGAWSITDSEFLGRLQFHTSEAPYEWTGDIYQQKDQ